MNAAIIQPAVRKGPNTIKRRSPPYFFFEGLEGFFGWAPATRTMVALEREEGGRAVGGEGG